MSDQLFCTGIYKEGYGIIPKSIMRSNLSCSAKVLYAYICSFTGAGNSAFPSLELMCNELGMSEKKIYKCRKELIDNNLIAIEKKRIGSKYTNNIYTIITNPISEKDIEPSHFERVQNEPSQNEPVQNDRVQESEETSHSCEPSQNGHVQNEPCPKVGTISNRLINKKEKEKKEKKTEFDELIEEYTDNELLKETLYEFIKMRKTIKAAITTTGLKRILTRLDKLASTENDKISILDNSIMNSWKGIFELKEIYAKNNVIPITTKSQKPVYEFQIDKSKLGDL
ncbi:helix-turn-helix domain-containing protein [Clostridium botulinum]|uniref:helix-turn-helix domain-containing protein n=1 Tax=Clostridium botulinum TaxID=1491 RepID=UPI000774452A|nr:helix-turn-helix domain-containing protein [Clostridium botulinum]NFF80417.1 helix-turn-helix domain-containing protein [Clostridium botulinum]NFH80816.1 helix-turn-helix domain-containing protein [Clostridium botulinum]NFH83193.1 helix-turn-helix domain-containing protein [Clostridium botulinum]NFI12058.1 helix-turn-helix domain-containing protein [Clostridium botulinum]NFI15793.1 helix-turn-helix domain-containing protein [Clostridium botulinum]